MATYQELRTRSQQVRDEQNIGGNTALRVGQLLMDIVKYFNDNDEAASEYLQQHFAMVNDGTQLLNWQQSPIVILHTMGETYDDGDFSALSQGENYYRAGFVMEANGQGGGINGETPKANVLYVNLANDTLYTWKGASFDAITTGGGGGSISGDDILKNAYYLNGNLVLVFETESGDKTVTIPVTFDASNYVPTSRTVNGKALSNNITLSQSDIPGLVAALAAKVGYSDDEWLQVKAGAMQAATAVPNTTTVNGKQLNDNIVIGMADIPGLGTAIGEAGKVKSVSVNNGTPAQPDSNGNVNIQVQTGSTISPATNAPSMDGTASVGSSAKYAREDHVHPHDTTKANASDVYSKTQTDTLLAGKQDKLTSSTTLITINGNAVHYGESVTVQGEKGDKGDTGNVQVDGNGNVLIYNGLDQTTAGSALDAVQGQKIGKLINKNGGGVFSVWVGTEAELEALDGDYEDNTIYLVGAVAVVPTRYSVTTSGLTNCTVPSSTPSTATEGRSFSITVSPESGYTIDTATGTMTGGTLTKTNNQDGTVTFSTSAVTGAITITAAATKHITGITVSAGTRTNNSIPLTAVVVPSGAENVTLAWSVNDTTNFGISGSGTDATLTVKSGASNSSVTITCQDTNASSGTASGTLQLTGITYEATPIPITEITDISATRTAANTLTLEATADGNTPITFSIVGTPPKSKKLDYTNSPATLEEVDSVELSGDTLSYKEDSKVTVKASAENGTVTFQKEITITHANADAIWFEDEVTLAALNSNSVGSGGKVTYTQAAAVTTLKFLAGNTSIRRFREFMWFTGVVSAGPNNGDKSNFKNCSNLECIGVPTLISGTFILNTASATNHPFYGCKLRELHAKSIVDYKVTINSDFARWVNAGKSSEGLGLFVDGQEVYDVVVPDGDYVTKKYAGLNRITGFMAEYITSFPVGSLYGCTALTTLKIGDDVTTIGEKAFSASGEALTSLRDVDLGSGISALGAQAFRGCTGLRTLTLRYDGVVTQDNSFYQAASMSNIDLYVPANQVSAYQATSPWSGAKSINAITE